MAKQPRNISEMIRIDGVPNPSPKELLEVIGRWIS
jgi:hypothetical protein